MTYDEFKAGIAATLGTLVEMYKNDDIQSLSVAVVRKSGDIRTFQHHSDNAKFPMLAATDILHMQAFDMCKLNTNDIPMPREGTKQ